MAKGVTSQANTIQGSVHDIGAGQPERRSKLPHSSSFKGHLLRPLSTDTQQRLPCRSQDDTCDKQCIWEGVTAWSSDPNAKDASKAGGLPCESSMTSLSSS